MLALDVDDEKAILDGYILALRREAYEILTAVSPVEALNVLATRRIDVVVSDERMPEMLGSDFLRQVRRPRACAMFFMRVIQSAGCKVLQRVRFHAGQGLRGGKHSRRQPAEIAGRFDSHDSLKRISSS